MSKEAGGTAALGSHSSWRLGKFFENFWATFGSKAPKTKMPPLRICAYNVLAQTLATSSFFPYASPHLKKATRVPLILKRLSALNADVLCLSEAFPDVVALLEQSGYAVTFKARAGRPYGICLAWRTATLECTACSALDLDDVADALATGPPGPLAPDTFRTNSLALFAALRFKAAVGGAAGDAASPPPAAGGGGGASSSSSSSSSAEAASSSSAAAAAAAPAGAPGSSFCVGTTHLFWDPRLEAVKASQAVALKLGAAEFSAQHCPGRPLLLGGDFNSMPGSWVCRVLEGAFPAGAPAAVAAAAAASGAGGGSGAVAQWDVLQRAPAERGAAGAAAWLARLQAQLSAELGGPVPERLAVAPAAPGAGLRSLYALARGAAGEPEITTATATFKECIDYIYALQGSVGLAQGAVTVQPLPTKAELGGPIPSATEPSDHLPLLAELEV